MSENPPESFDSKITQLQDRLKKFENKIEQKITEKKRTNPELELIEKRLRRLSTKLDGKKQSEKT